MAQRISNSFVNTNRPGSYFEQKVNSNQTGVGVSGNIVIFGEADSGAASSVLDSVDGDLLKDNWFTPDQVNQVIAKYGSGNIVDAFNALIAASSDDGITGAPNRIYIAKTNVSAKASVAVAPSYGVFSDQNFGKAGNKFYYQITQSESEVAPSITSDAISFSAVAQETQIVADTLANTTDGQYFDIDSQSGVQYRVYMDTTGGDSTQPAAAGRTLTRVDLSSVATAADVADAVAAVLDGLADFSAPSTGTGTIIVTDANEGDVVDAVNGDLANAWAISVATQGDDANGEFLDGLSFSVRQNGGVVSVVTLSVGESSHDTVAELAAEIDALLPSGLSCQVSGTSQIQIKSDDIANAAANAMGYGRSFELVDSTLGDLNAIGLSEGLVVASQEPEVEVSFANDDTGLNETFTVEASIALTVGYEGTSATISIEDGELTTSVAGGVGADLTIDLSDFTTIADLASFIDAQAGYSASVASGSSQTQPIYLDEVDTVSIASSGADIEAGRIKRGAYDFSQKVSQSTAISFEASATAGIPSETSGSTFLAGGAKGGTSAADIVTVINNLASIDVNFVVPLFSRDASEDIAEGLTDSSSTYTIGAVNALTKNHTLAMSTVKIKKHRSAFLSIWDTYLNAKAQASTMAHHRVSVAMQKSGGVSSLGEQTIFLPWATACKAAGMQAAGFYKAIVNKAVNVTSIVDPEGFDSGSVGDIEDALDSGLLFMEQLVSDIRWVSDQTTYGRDTNFVYNSIQAVYAADLIALDLSASFKEEFVGQSLADVDAATARSFLATKMEAYKVSKLIAASDDAPLGYINDIIIIEGPIMSVSVEVKLATAIYFIPISIQYSQVSSAA